MERGRERGAAPVQERHELASRERRDGRHGRDAAGAERGRRDLADEASGGGAGAGASDDCYRGVGRQRGTAESALSPAATASAAGRTAPSSVTDREAVAENTPTELRRKRTTSSTVSQHSLSWSPARYLSMIAAGMPGAAAPPCVRVHAPVHEVRLKLAR